VQLQDRTALVTGAGSGLGRATAAVLAAAGAHVVLADLPSSEGAAVAEQLGASACFHPVDVTDEQDVRDALDLAQARYGDLHVVVNCAGVHRPQRIGSKRGPMPLDVFTTTVSVNLTGTFNVMRLAADRMRGNELDGDEERGVIVNTASVAAWEGQIGHVAYAASKAGVVGMTLPAARDLADAQIRVMAIAPGVFETAMVADVAEEHRDSLAKDVPHPRRLGRPDEFAALVRHIVENPFLNGEVIRLDAALRMPPR
jgi:NAD(P)-dependent dehydrogenase (short-subunit alcohol dehydrogenase family)